MKKAFAIIVCLWTLFGICGCGANSPDKTKMVKDSKMEIAPEIVPEKNKRVQQNPVRQIWKIRF